jgi:hypothetical protein
MPWTFAHPVAVLPFRRFCPRWLNFPALVVGSISPDFGYHLLSREMATYAHTLKGSLGACLPAGFFALAVLFLLRKPGCHLLPEPHRSALAPWAEANPPLDLRFFATIIVSLLVGAWTHIAWDAVTHNDGWFVLRMPLLAEVLFELGGMPFPLYHVLQHACSWFGIAVLAAAYWSWLRRSAPGAPGFRRDDLWRYQVLAGIVVVSLMIALGSAAAAAVQFHKYHALRVFAFRALVDGVSAFVLLYALGSILCYRRQRAALPLKQG